MAFAYDMAYDTPPPTPEIDQDDEGVAYWSLEKCKRAYLDFVGSKQAEIEEQKVARRYRHGVQWEKDQIDKFNLRKQPVVTFNRIGRKIDAIVGLLEKLRQDPKAFPRTPHKSAEQSAELATAIIRYVVESDLRDNMFPFIIDKGATDGYGGVELKLEEGDHGDPDIGFAMVEPDEFFYDPRSFRHDFSDARYMGTSKWLDLDDAKQLFPEHADELDGGSLGEGTEFTTDPDREHKWFDSNRYHKRVRVVDIWYKHQGGWCWTMYIGSRKLVEGKSYFFNEKGKPICKYIMFSAFVDQDGDRYGFGRNMKSSQDEINQRRSKGLHELNSRRIFAEDGAFANVEIARREAVRPDGVVIRNKGFEAEFDDAARLANIEGQIKFLEDAKAEIENFGPNPALIGQGLEYKSGRAINLLQQAGIAELGPFVIGVKNWKLRLYRAIWCAVQRYWTSERWVRVTDNQEVAQYLQVNGLEPDEFGLPRMVNALGQLDVDIVMEEGPDEVNMMGDAYDTLVALTAQGANIPPVVLLHLAPLHNSLKQKLLDLVTKPDPMADAAKQVAIQGEAAKVEETRSKTAMNFAKAQETAQGGAHGIVERQMDMAAKEREAQLRERELAVKTQATAAQARTKMQSEFMKLRTNAALGAQKVRQSAMDGAMKMRQNEQMHQQRMRQQPTDGGAK